MPMVTCVITHTDSDGLLWILRQSNPPLSFFSSLPSFSSGSSFHPSILGFPFI